MKLAKWVGQRVDSITRRDNQSYEIGGEGLSMSFLKEKSHMLDEGAICAKNVKLDRTSFKIRK